MGTNCRADIGRLCEHDKIGECDSHSDLDPEGRQESANSMPFPMGRERPLNSAKG